MNEHYFRHVLGRFEKLKRCPNRPLSWLACCPAHDDRRPSLWLYVTRKGNLAFWCNAGCPFEEILMASGVNRQDCLFREEQSQYGSTPRRQDSSSSGSSKREIVAVYDYQDAEGNLLYQKLRYKPKDFRQRRPDGKGGWTWDLGDVERVPYRLPELLAEPTRQVLFVEGERDVESLRALGLLATTTSETAKGYRIETARWLAGRHVAVIPDNDEAGEHYAILVAGSLIARGAASVRIVRLAGVGESGDITDYLTDALPNVTAEQKKKALIELIKAAPLWRCGK